MIVVDIYTKSDCHLCDVAKEVIARVQESVPFELRVTDIEADADLRATYGERIPVVFIAGELAYEFRVPEADFRRRLAALRRPAR